MRDHFDITLERKLESSGDDADGVSHVRRIELITGTGRRRRWSDDDKARIVVESFVPGANVSEIARRNCLSPQQLFAWRREARVLFQDGDNRDEAVCATEPHSQEADAKAPPFVPVVIASNAPPPPPTKPSASSVIEIVIGDMVVRTIGEIEPAKLVAVLRAVRRSA